MSKPAIPAVLTGQPLLDKALSAVKQTLDAITGQARNVERMQPLPITATTEQIIERMNEISERLQ
jgi:hypothetical protein